MLASLTSSAEIHLKNQPQNTESNDTKSIDLTDHSKNRLQD